MHVAHSLQERVEKAGGQVLYWNGHRVMGVLAMSRAIGDHCLRPYVIPEPEVSLDESAWQAWWMDWGCTTGKLGRCHWQHRVAS